MHFNKNAELFNALAPVESKKREKKSTYKEKVKKSESYGGERKQRKKGRKKKEGNLKTCSTQ
jgi:hypothetical protein